MSANDEYNFSLHFSQGEVTGYEYGDLGAYVNIIMVSGAEFRLKMLNGDVEYQVKNPGASDFETFATSTLHMDLTAEYTV